MIQAMIPLLLLQMTSMALTEAQEGVAGLQEIGVAIIAAVLPAILVHLMILEAVRLIVVVATAEAPLVINPTGGAKGSEDDYRNPGSSSYKYWR